MRFLRLAPETHAWKKGSNQIIPQMVVKDGDSAWKKVLKKNHLKQI